MKIKDVSLETVAGFTSQFPQAKLPEIALAGRSNVGKSSLVNSLAARKKLAKTSSKPGKTRTINFYNVDGLFRLVDLPGYGYAKASKKEMAQWADLINEYLAIRDNLIDVLLIVDARHEPSQMDKEMYDWILANGFTGYVIATKLDKLGRSKLDRVRNNMAQELQTDRHLVIPYSSQDGYGKDRVLGLLAEIIKK